MLQTKRGKWPRTSPHRWPSLYKISQSTSENLNCLTSRVSLAEDMCTCTTQCMSMCIVVYSPSSSLSVPPPPTLSLCFSFPVYTVFARSDTAATIKFYFIVRVCAAFIRERRLLIPVAARETILWETVDWYHWSRRFWPLCWCKRKLELSLVLDCLSCPCHWKRVARHVHVLVFSNSRRGAATILFNTSGGAATIREQRLIEWIWYTVTSSNFYFYTVIMLCLGIENRPPTPLLPPKNQKKLFLPPLSSIPYMQ